MESFAASANLKALLQRTDNSEILQQCAATIETVAARHGSGLLDTDAERKQSHSESSDRSKPLPAQVSSSFSAAEAGLSTRISNWSTPKSGMSLKRVFVNGVKFCSVEGSRKDSAVFFQPLGSESCVPGVIKAIFKIPLHNEDCIHDPIFFIVARYHDAPTSTFNPFASHPGFPAIICSDELSNTLEVLPTTNFICHSISRPWEPNTLILKPLDKV